MSIFSLLDRAIKKVEPVIFIETELPNKNNYIPITEDKQTSSDSFQDVLNTVRQLNLGTKTYRSISKLPKKKGSNANIEFHNSKELNRILNQCKGKYETCNVFHNIGIVALINRK